MREIRFRGYDVKRGEYFHCLQSMHFDKAIGGTFLSTLDEMTLWEPDVIFEQFTGLLDKNGKAIYENDLLQLPDNTGRIGLVQFSHGLFGLNWDWKESRDPCYDGIILGGWGNKTNLRPMYDYLIESLQIIGTIHDAEYKEPAK